MGKIRRKNIFGELLKMFIIILFIIFGYVILKGTFYKGIGTIDMYISSTTSKVNLYDENYNQSITINRGEKVRCHHDNYTNNDIIYKKIIYNDNTYYILSDDIVNDYSKVVKETKMYVRTPVTVYKTNDDVSILGHLPKGSEVDILGFNKIIDGNVDMYKIKYNDNEGYVYAKYLLNNKEDADKPYDPEKTYLIHKDRKYFKELYGGYASDLDYYPYEKVTFKDNVMPDDTRTLYLNGSESVLNNIDNYISLAKESNINAFVVDIKDGYLAYQSDVAKEYSISSYNSAPRSKEDYKNIITKLKDNGFYVIGRIVAFNDSLFAKDNNESAISHNGEATSWVSAYSRKAWEYNVRLAIESSNLGFNEIQFDYVRFPETAYSMSKDSSYDMKNTYNEEKAQAIQGFIFYATDELHKNNTYISVDVFGESANPYVTAYGQYFPAISNIVDVISAMPYPDHFNIYAYGSKVPVWTDPYTLLTKWGSDASARQEEIPTPAKVRTWIQAYDAIHEPKIEYTSDLVSSEIKALYDSGLKNGYITWNASSNINKYKSISTAFKKDYR